MRIRVVMLAVLMFLLVAAALALPFVLRAPESIFHTSPMRISSSVFEHGWLIPVRYTCDGENISPPLSIADVPANTVSLALIMDDPDVPTSVREDGLWVHWVITDLDVALTEIPASVDPTTLGNPWVNTRWLPIYGGPCPPDREHRYFFRLYALDRRLDLSTGATKDQVEKAMDGHIIAEATLMGRYDRPR